MSLGMVMTPRSRTLVAPRIVVIGIAVLFGVVS